MGAWCGTEMHELRIENRVLYNQNDKLGWQNTHLREEIKQKDQHISNLTYENGRLNGKIEDLNNKMDNIQKEVNVIKITRITSVFN